MVHRKHSHFAAPGNVASPQHGRVAQQGDESDTKQLEIVLKCDSPGSIEAVVSILSSLKVPGVELAVIDSGVGPVSKSDLLMALTGSKFVLGFNVEVMPKLDTWIKDQGAEVRIYDVIYKLAEDMKEIARSLTLPDEEERITGKAKVIALFKSSHKGIILGCEVQEGTLAVGDDFRVIAAMGPVHRGKIESLQIERRAIKQARVGQQIGLKISDFSQVRVGDLVECFERVSHKKPRQWQPSGSIIYLKS